MLFNLHAFHRCVTPVVYTFEHFNIHYDHMLSERCVVDPMRDIACGWEHSLVCSKNGTCYSFGHPMYGQLGHGTTGR